MYAKITFLTALIAISHGGVIVDHQGHQTLSSQSLIRHDQPQLDFTTLTHGPVVHASPVVEHSAILQHTPVVHQGPLIHAVHHTGNLVHAPVAIGHAARLEEEHHAPAHYEYSYSVEDPNTGDHKSHRESREGDVVKGEYSLVQPDGSVRKVEYTADDHSGFNAIVHTSAPNAHALPPQVHAAPVVHAPVVHAGPIVHSPFVHATPVFAGLHH